MKLLLLTAMPATILLFSCNGDTTKNNISARDSAVTVPPATPDTIQNKIAADAATVLARKQVPVLCYHHIREPKPGQSESFKSYSVSPAQFAEHMKALKDSGYETILPDELYNYLVYGGKLPAKPVMLTFDDTDEEQYSIGAMEMRKYGFKGVYFIMTISINRPRYMSKEQLKDLSETGNPVESHTWDHHMVTKYHGADWDTQLVKPAKKIEEITGKKPEYFAYPFGLWNQAAIPELKSRGYKMAFILSTKRDSTEPLYTVRRMIVPGQWSTPGMMKSMKQTFHLND
ncbi:MAG: polysaccharide deacetylase family protein [Ginsengibacter sp.]